MGFYYTIKSLDNMIPDSFNSLEEIQAAWENTEDVHRHINLTLTKQMNDDWQLMIHRNWVEANIWGFGERSFHWMWKLIVDKMTDKFSFLEIGVFRGQVLSLLRMLAMMQQKKAEIYGITPLTSDGVGWESNYREDVAKIHAEFSLPLTYELIEGYSTDAGIIEKAASYAPYDIMYIDGGHDYDVVKSDLQHYPTMVKLGGYLVIDDSANKYKLPEGYFPGIADVSRATDEILPNESFKELFNVVHNRIFQRVK